MSPRHGPRNPRSRCPDCRRRAGRDVGRAARWRSCRRPQGGEPLAIAVLEKAREAGAHMLSGAVLDPSALRLLIPDFKERARRWRPKSSTTTCTSSRAAAKVTFPITPPPLANHGNYIISLNRFVKWLGGLVEAEGVDVFTGFPAVEVLYDERPCRRRADGRPRHRQARRAEVRVRAGRGHPREGHDPGRRRARQPDQGGGAPAGARRRPPAAALRARDQGAVGRAARSRCRPGTVMHTMGFPLRMEEFGGGFIYSMPEGRLAVGFVCGLDYQDPMFDPHVRFQHFKRHPFVARAPGRRADGALRREGAARRRLAHDSARLRRRPADCRRRRRIPQLDAAQGHAPGDAHRHARGRGGVRRHHQRRRVGGRPARLRGGDRRERGASRTLSGPQRPPELRLRIARRPGLLRAVAGIRRLVGPRSDAGARRLRADPEDRRVLPRRPPGSRCAA